MARKYELILKLYEDTCDRITASPENWMSFLLTASYNYRLPFDSQILIHAQKPDATAVLEAGRWSKNFNRWVNRGAKGIAVFDTKNPASQKLIHYFDISDTHEGRPYARPVPIWTMRQEYTAEVIETLENSFGELENKETLAEAVFSAASNGVEDHIPDYLPDLFSKQAGSKLEGIEPDTVKAMYKELVANSVSYMVLSRLGIGAEGYLTSEDFRFVPNFGTKGVLHALGYASGAVSEIALSQIAKTVGSLTRNHALIAQAQTEEYNKKEEKREERGIANGADIHEDRGLLLSGSGNAATAEVRNGDLREGEKQISEGTSGNLLSGSSDELHTGTASEGDTGESARHGGKPDQTDGEGTGRNGETQGGQSDGVGAPDEQHHPGSEGDRDERGDLRLEYHDYSREDKSLPGLYGDKKIKAILLNTPYLAASSEEIKFFYEENRDQDVREKYIKSIFNNDATEFTLPDGSVVGYKTMQNALHLWEGHAENKTSQSWYHWRTITGFFEGMRLLGELDDPMSPVASPDGQLNFSFVGRTENRRSVFSFTQEMIDAVLTRGSGIEQGKMRIYEQYQKSLSAKENAEFLKNEYGWGGSYPVIIGTGIGEQHDGKGITISKGIGIDASKLTLKWNQVEKRIGELIRMDRYLNPKEKEAYPQWLEKQEVLRTKRKEEQKLREMLRTAPTEKPSIEAAQEETAQEETVQEKTVPEETVQVQQEGETEKEHPAQPGSENTDSSLPDTEKHEYSIGDTIYLGASEYEIIALDEDRIELQDTQMPLFRKEYTRDAFDQMLPQILDMQDAIAETEEAIEEGEIDEEPSVYPYKDAFFVDQEYKTVTWISYREDGQYVGDGAFLTTTLIFSEVALAAKKGSFTASFFDQLSFIGSKETAQWQTDAFKKAEKQFLEKPDFTECTQETMEKLISAVQQNKLTDTIRQEETAEPIVPAWEKKRKVSGFDLHPEIPYDRRNMFDLANHPVETVGKKERFRRNLTALQVLKKCREENRFASPIEQEILSKYVGWGGLAEAFDEENTAWRMEYLELRAQLSEEEYTAARESTLTAFYTPPEVITAIYKALEQMGLHDGNLLEPSCGIGNFIGMLPETMRDTKIYGVELDPVSAGIAQQLYQKSSIAAQGFEEVNLPDSFFDGVVGNVPFGDFKVMDRRYNKYNFLIHDYFFAKSLDKLRPGGIMALVTSKGTMDKANPNVRKYIAQRADLLGAIRLPNDTFKGNAGTEVVSDILFLQKRDRIVDIAPDWVYLDKDENGIAMNAYFVSHPEMILGEMKLVSGRFGQEATCVPYENADLAELLEEAIANIHGEITVYEEEADDLEEEVPSIPADPSVRNFSYTLIDDKLYYRENSRMRPVQVSATAQNRIKGMIAIRDCVRRLIELQTENYPDEEIKSEQARLNTLYDAFTEKYGLLSKRANISAFHEDSSFALLSALEVIDENGELERKADMFSKRTIMPHIPITSVDTASEALAVSLSEKACVDMPYMAELSGKTEEEICNDLKGVIFKNPQWSAEQPEQTVQKYLPADEYLSGNVREKLRMAQEAVREAPEEYAANVEALEKVQPKDLSASEISVRLGSTWIPSEVYKRFVFEFLETPMYLRWHMEVNYSAYTGEWNLVGKSSDKGNIKAYSTYGTGRINAYKIIEETLNLKDVRIYDTVEDPDGKQRRVLNKKETAIAQAKQELIKQGFQDWIWEDPTRRMQLTKLYNERFNSSRPREYDGSHITFSGMNPEISLRNHQKNAVAHILYGGNTLLAHAVGAGKTYEMVAAAQESKRLGLCSKAMFVVPNHLTEQWAAEYLQLYPAANILVATKKDFETRNRKRFCGRIATGDYDAVIIGHSQFEKIPMSAERQKALLEMQIDELTEGIRELKEHRGDKFSVKQLEKARKSIEVKLAKLNDQSKKDDVVTFEELGVDRIFIDESHYYKNLYLYTKMRNVGGIAQTEAQKSSDLFMKCRYLDEITNGRGTVFATGTPISNSMVEMYTIQRYLQYDALVKNNLQHFDSWASTFGETVTAVELTPEGTGYRAKTRFAKFYNLPELMSMFKETADIKTADMLHLPVPEAEYHNVSVEPSRMQEEMVESLAERAERVRNGMVDSSTDNMLKITNDGRKLALDQRMINPMLPDFEGSKVNACVNNVYQIWKDNAEKKSAQLIFCDLSTPKKDGTFSVYNDIRDKLIQRGIPESEVQFIHDADTDAKKDQLFRKVRLGEVRVLMGSTQKMGAGTNVQDRLIALHDLDCPWRPSDLEQRSGRIIRQGNTNPKVHIYRYVTKQTFDAYLYQLVEGKQKFASQIMTSKSPVRSAEDIDETALSYAEIKMLATGNPYIKEKMDLDIQVQKLKMLKSNFLSEKFRLEDKLISVYPQKIAALENRIAGLEEDVKTAKQNTKGEKDSFVGMEVQGFTYTDKRDAGNAILHACKVMTSPDPVPLGTYRGFQTELYFDKIERNYYVAIKGKTTRHIALGEDVYGNITRIDNAVDRFETDLADARLNLENTRKQFADAGEEAKKEFPQEEELKTKLARLDALNILLNMDKTENEIIGDAPEMEEEKEETPTCVFEAQKQYKTCKQMKIS